jgi:hypothetical protein
MESKIYCSLEGYDSILNSNRPNGSSRSWYLEELKEIQYPMMWGDWNIFKDCQTKTGLIQGEEVRSMSCPLYGCEFLDYRNMDQIGDNPHLYIISVYHPFFFENTRNIGFSCISPKYLEDIRKGKCKIVICCYNEGYSGSDGNNDLEIIEEWRIKSNLPSKSVYYVTANLIADKIAKEKGLDLEVKCLGTFEPCVKFYYEDDNIIPFNPIDDKHLYLSYNRQIRFQRQKFVGELRANELLGKGLVSLGKITDYTLCRDIDEELQQWYLQNTPLTISDDITPNLACNIYAPDFERTFMSAVTETLTNKGTLFLSEKTWKPLLVGHPFVTYANKGTLEYLRSIGYKTFGQWFDESYDNVEDETTRYKMVVEQIIKYKDKSADELKAIRKEMEMILIHNQLHFRQMFKERYNVRNESLVLIQYFQEIWDTIKDK